MSWIFNFGWHDYKFVETIDNVFLDLGFFNYTIFTLTGWYLGNIVIHFQVTHFMWKKLCLLMELNFVSMSDTQIYHDNFVWHWIFQYPWPLKKCDFRNQANLVFFSGNFESTGCKSQIWENLWVQNLEGTNACTETNSTSIFTSVNQQLNSKKICNHLSIRLQLQIQTSKVWNVSLDP